eukprot:gene18757-24524_t
MSRRYRDAPKSDLASQREMLDNLMGLNRNDDGNNGTNGINDYNDERVCKFYLLGMCPHDMFINTKVDCGPCDKIHSDYLKQQFELNVTGEKLYKYDTILEKEFAPKVHDIDRVIEKARGRLELEKNEDETNPDLNPESIRLTAEIHTLTLEAEAAGEEGDIDKAQEIMGKIEELQKLKQEIATRITEKLKVMQAKIGNDVNKKLRVCDVCGSFLSIFDSDNRRLQDHFIGKQHYGFQVMRDTLAAIKQRKEAKKSSNNISSDDRNEVREKDRDRDESSKRRSGDRDRERSSDRKRRDSRDRDYRRRSRDRGSRRYRDDSRDRDRRR